MIVLYMRFMVNVSWLSHTWDLRWLSCTWDLWWMSHDCLTHDTYGECLMIVLYMRLWVVVLYMRLWVNNNNNNVSWLSHTWDFGWIIIVIIIMSHDCLTHETLGECLMTVSYMRLWVNVSWLSHTWDLQGMSHYHLVRETYGECLMIVSHMTEQDCTINTVNTPICRRPVLSTPIYECMQVL